MMLLLRALVVGLAIPVVTAASLAAQEPGNRTNRRPPPTVVPPELPPLVLPKVHGDNQLLEVPLRGGRPAFLRAQTKPTQQEAFTPISELPPEEQLAAAPLLVGAYVFVLVALFGYLVTVARRLNTIERDISRLASDLKASEAPPRGDKYAAAPR
jgi:CcmD family protein